ncbi:hypothetical protein R6Q57_002135 [Mikania cordata]
MGMPRCIDWGVLEDCGEAGRARAILGEDTPWTLLFELEELPTYRLITVEFLSTFRYQAHQAAVRAEDDAELIPDIEFSLGGQHFEMSIERPCNLTRCFALYYASLYHRQERGTLWGGAFITHIARTRGMVDMLDDLPAIEPRKLDRRTIISMKLAAVIPDLGLRFIGQDGRPFQPAHVVVVPNQQQDSGPIPEPDPIREELVQSPPREEVSPQHPSYVYHAVRLTEPLEMAESEAA